MVVTTSLDSWANAVAVAVSVCVVLTAAAAAAAAAASPAASMNASDTTVAMTSPAAKAERARGEQAQHVHVGERLRLRRRQRDDQAQRLLGVLDQPDLAALGQGEQLRAAPGELFRLGGQAGQVDVPDRGAVLEDPDGHAVRDLEALVDQDFSRAGQQPVR